MIYTVFEILKMKTSVILFSIFSLFLVLPGSIQETPGKCFLNKYHPSDFFIALFHCKVFNVTRNSFYTRIIKAFTGEVCSEICRRALDSNQGYIHVFNKKNSL